MSYSASKGRREISFDEILRMTRGEKNRIHFVGIGGVSMYSLARMSIKYGAFVSGSDVRRSKRTDILSSLGAEIYFGHSQQNIKNVNLVVYSHAISETNPELVYARQIKVPTVTRAEFLGALMLDFSCRIGVSGSHGKSTTVAMLDGIFSLAGRLPTTLSGANLTSGDSIRYGSKDLLIYEACEYRDSYHRFSPTVFLGLNLELDHTDYFDNINSLKRSFLKAAGRARELVVFCGDDPNLSDIYPYLKKRKVTFGEQKSNTYRYEIISFNPFGYDIALYKLDNKIDNFTVNIPGVYNVKNAVGAIVCAIECGVSIDIIKAAVASFSGIDGRLEMVGQRGGRKIYLDYAHHPTEIFSALTALRSISSAVTIVFKPHTFTRTRDLWDDFKRSLSLADHIILTDIYPAREEPINGVTSKRLAEEIGTKAVYANDSDIVDIIDYKTCGNIVLMGAGDLSFLIPLLT